MTSPDAIAAIAGQSGLAALAIPPGAEAQSAATMSFGDLIARGIGEVEARVDHANELVRGFVVGDSIPVHEVTIALEEARIAIELAMQVRSRIVEGYREIMGMQL